jgi:bis(5'-nucleosyl)-tetraphosphatase (symmetrical)
VSQGFRYVIGDVQGCYQSLCSLLQACQFDVHQDRLWLVGDMVNRGPDNLSVLRMLKGLGERAVCVLGNHDFFLLAVAAGAVEAGPEDTIQDVLSAADCDSLVDWLRHRPMMHVEETYAMVHAGLLPQWSIAQAQVLAEEVQKRLRADDWKLFMRTLWGGKPQLWSDALQGEDRLRIIVNVFCRLRFMKPDGLSFDLKPKGPPEKNPDFLPWYAVREPKWNTHCIIHGHWSAIGYRNKGRVIALDSGCVWGGQLTAYRLEDGGVFRVDSSEGVQPSGWD